MSIREDVTIPIMSIIAVAIAITTRSEEWLEVAEDGLDNAASISLVDKSLDFVGDQLFALDQSFGNSHYRFAMLLEQLLHGFEL